MPRNRLKNRTFEEVTEDAFSEAREAGLPKMVIDDARTIVEKFRGRPGNRYIMAVASLFISCKINDMPGSQAALGRVFNTAEASIRKYVRILLPDVDLREMYLEKTKPKFSNVFFKDYEKYDKGDVHGQN